MSKKICTLCGRSTPEVTFGWRTVSGRRYPNTRCVKCKSKFDRRYQKNPDSVREINKRRYSKRKQERTTSVNRAKYVFWDTRQMDFRLGRENDLTKEFIETLVSQPCSYCGETELKMTLDRIDNAFGHLQSNVVGACIRCNFIRRDMPYIVWMRLVPELRKVRVEGLLGNWIPHTKRKSTPGALAESGIALAR